MDVVMMLGGDVHLRVSSQIPALPASGPLSHCVLHPAAPRYRP